MAESIPDPSSDSVLRIPYGLRRYPLALAVFGLGGLGFLAWASQVSEPTYVFPLGLLSPGVARIAIGAVGVSALAYGAALSWVRFGSRPTIELGDGRVRLPVGEFGFRTVELRPGEVMAVREDRTRGGWRILRIVHRGVQIEVPSSRLPDDAAYERVHQAVLALVPRG